MNNLNIYVVVCMYVYTDAFGNWCDFQVKWINLVQWENEQEISIHGIQHFGWWWFEENWIYTTYSINNIEQFYIQTCTHSTHTHTCTISVSEKILKFLMIEMLE